MKKAVVLVSGGLDSCVTAAIAIEAGYEVAFLHINYGQLTQNRELAAFNDIANHYNISKRLVVDISYLKDIGGSSLTDTSIKVEEGATDEVGSRLPSTYVPFRNGNMIAIAVSFAEVYGAEKIFIGAVEEDSSGYPDCRAEFFDRFNSLLQIGLSPDCHLQIETPIITLSKADIVALGLELNAPLHLTWSCYQNEDEACGLCESCFLRLRGFKIAGIKDPIKYKY